MHAINEVRKAQEKAKAQKLADDTKQKVERELKHAQALPLVRDRFLKAISLEPKHVGVFRNVNHWRGSVTFLRQTGKRPLMHLLHH